MNAIIHEKYEASVLTNEAIEVHLHYLRSGFDSMQAALPVLRDKIDRVSETVSSNFEKTNARIDALIDRANEQRAAGDVALAEKIDRMSEQSAARDAALAEKIDKVNEQSAARDAALSEKIDKASEKSEVRDTALGKRIDTLTEKVLKVSDGLAEVQSYQKALFWVLSTAGIVAAIVSIARTLNWI